MYTESDKEKKIRIQQKIQYYVATRRHARALPGVRVSAEYVIPSSVAWQAHALSKGDMNDTNLQYDTVLQPWQMKSMRCSPWRRLTWSVSVRPMGVYSVRWVYSAPM